MKMRKKLVLIALFLCCEAILGFQSVYQLNGRTNLASYEYNRPSTETSKILHTTFLVKIPKSESQLAMDLSGLSNFFNFGNDGDDDKNKQRESDSSSLENDDDEGEYAGCTNIFTIDAKSLKLGACRLYLSLYFMGESNNPEKRTWRMNQNGDGGIDLYYKDTSAALIVVFKEDAILVNRLGSSPSMEYLMQESNMLNGMLDQLDEISMDSSINENDRLLCIEGDQVDKVRQSLSFT
jgi:hypothetical protein